MIPCFRAFEKKGPKKTPSAFRCFCTGNFLCGVEYRNGRGETERGEREEIRQGDIFDTGGKLQYNIQQGIKLS